MINAQYNARLLDIAPLSAIFLILHKSKMVINITNAKMPKVTTEYKALNTEPVKNINNQLNNDNIPTPIAKPIITIHKGAKFPLEIKAIKLMIKKAKAVIPKAMPISLQSMTIVNMENKTPTRTA